MTCSTRSRASRVFGADYQPALAEPGVNGSLPMLSRVSRPIGTSPNQRLRHLARRLDQSTMNAEALERITGRVTTLPVTSWMTAPPRVRTTKSPSSR